tara:strand:- start:105 stop:767 length:663 start_codon:yes stop_codon:yes gene_type:complete
MRIYYNGLLIFVTLFQIQFLNAQPISAKEFVSLSKEKALQYKDQSFSFTLTLDAMGRDGTRIERKNKGTLLLVGQTGVLTLNDQMIFLESSKLISVSGEDEEIVVRRIDTSDANFSPSKILNRYSKGTRFKYLDKKVNDKNTLIQFIELVPLNPDEVEKVILGIEVKSKKIYSYHEYGLNKVITKVQLDNYLVNMGMKLEDVKFDLNNYPDYDYIAPEGM